MKFKKYFQIHFSRKTIFLLCLSLAAFIGYFLYVNEYIFQFRAVETGINVTLQPTQSSYTIDDEVIVNVQATGDEQSKPTGFDLYVTYDSAVLEYKGEMDGVTGFSQVAEYFQEPLIHEGVEDIGGGKKQIHIAFMSREDIGQAELDETVSFNLHFNAIGSGTAQIQLADNSEIAGITTNETIAEYATPAEAMTMLEVGSDGIPTPTDGSGPPQVRIRVEDEQGNPVAVKNMFRLECVSGHSGCTDSSVISTCRHDQYSSNTAEQVFSISTSGTCRSGAGMIFNQNEYEVKSIITNPETGIRDQYDVPVSSDYEEDHIWDSWSSGLRAVTYIVAPLTTPSVTTTPSSSPTTSISPQPENQNVQLNMKLRFQGITIHPSAGRDQMQVRTIVSSTDESFRQERTVTFTADGSGLWNGVVDLANVPLDKTYAVYTKGPKHLQRNVCEAYPREPAPGFYKCETPSITLEEGANEMDFSNIYQLAGDLPVQNGVVDALDITFIRNNFASQEPVHTAQGDLNLDGIVDTQDYSLIIVGLGFKYDEGL